MGYVYLVKDTVNNTYKIGVSKDINKRLKTLQTGNSSNLELILSFKAEHPYRLESMLHRKFAEYRERNEWFKLPKDIVDSFHFYCNQLNSIIISLKDNPYYKI